MIKRIIGKLLNVFSSDSAESKSKSQHKNKSKGVSNKSNNNNKTRQRTNDKPSGQKSRVKDSSTHAPNKADKRHNNNDKRRKPTNNRNNENSGNNNSYKKNQRPNNNQNRNQNNNRNHDNKQQNRHVQGTVTIVEHVVHEKVGKLEEIKAVEGKLRFTDLNNLHEDILHGLQYLKFQYCTPIQQLSLPHSLDKKDVVGRAQTGTGKTAAFLITLFNHILQNPIENRRNGSCRAVVLAPTRELAIQIHKDAEQLSRYFAASNLVVFGGAGHAQQREVLRTKPIDILVGTPGRILDYLRGGDLHLGRTEMLVIDEADRMLDMGFIPDVRSIVVKTPRPGNRQTMFFSATFDDKILRLVDSWLKDPIRVDDEADSAVTDLIEQTFVTVCRNEKFAYLLWLLRNEKINRMMIFGNRKDKNYILYKNLRDYGVRCELLAGDVPQNKRMRILDDFKAGKIKIIIATDVAARGIHVKGVSHVVNYDLPERAEDYIHRIGRTGRAGETGKSISFVCEYGAYVLGDIEELVGITAKCDYLTDDHLKLPTKEEMKQAVRNMNKNSDSLTKENESKEQKTQNDNIASKENATKAQEKPEAVAVTEDVKKETVVVEAQEKTEAVAVTEDVKKETVVVEAQEKPEAVAVTEDVKKETVVVDAQEKTEAVAVTEDVKKETVVADDNVDVNISITVD